MSLGGQHIIEKASCLRCADITKKFEQDVARGLWGDARTSYGAPSRRKRERQSHLVLPHYEGNTNPIEVPFSDYPAPMVFYKMPQAGLLRGLPEDHDTSASWTLISLADNERIQKFEEKYNCKLTGKFKHVPESFVRLLAKIGFGQVLCSIDPTDFNPICLPYILGTKKNLSYIVGGRESIAEMLPGIGYSMDSHLFGTEDRAVIMAEIRLFANNGTPTYHVVVGDVSGEENVKRVRDKLAATCTVDMPPQFDSPRIPPDSLHWMPRVWPLNHWTPAAKVGNAS